MKVLLLLSVVVTLTCGQDTPVFRSDAVRARALRPPSRSGGRPQFAAPAQQPRPAPRFPQFSQQQQFQQQPRFPPPSFSQQQQAEPSFRPEPQLPPSFQQQSPQPIETRFQPRPQAPPQQPRFQPRPQQPPPQQQPTRFLPRPQPPVQQPVQFQPRPQPAQAPQPRPRPQPRPVLRQDKTTTTPSPPVAILKQISQHNDDGSYTYGYQGGDGSFKLETRSADGTVKGKYGYVDANGEQVVIEYGANSNGFQPTGTGINVPPLPEHKEGEEYDEQGFLIVKDSPEATRVARPLPRPQPVPSPPVQQRRRPVQPSAARPAAPIDVQRQFAPRQPPPPRQDFTQAVPVSRFAPAQPQAPQNFFAQSPQTNFLDEEEEPSLPQQPFSFSSNINFGGAGGDSSFNSAPARSFAPQPTQNRRQFDSTDSFKNLFDGFFQ